MKHCIKCNQNKELDEFYPNKRYSLGRISWCMECCKKSSKINRDKYKLELVKESSTFVKKCYTKIE
jgi:hypothetical protein